ncbi:HD domain-containing protein [Yersinia enterocolitica]
MAGFENTHLWQSSLAKQLGTDEYEKEREFFRVSYESFREKAAVLAGEISITMPNYTVHDITHIDALWDMASIICGGDIKLNPAEAFVLGGAFLIHDLGMGLAAYPLGLENIKKEILWSDTVAHLKCNNKNYTEDMIEKEALENVLRSLHARHADELALISWGGSGKDIYLIDNSELRADYGHIIGKIAYSHWWDANELTLNLAKTLGASGTMPKDWIVDPIKLACIMRVADASHIDSRRAPLFLKTIRELSGYSAQHWDFQQKLYQPRLEGEQLVYTSKSSFKIQDSKSWWLCYDSLVMIDGELRAVDSILAESKRERFKAKGVAGINNFNVVSRLIETSGWFPVDTRIHVGNVARLVKNLGGNQLYGDDNTVPLRELIQNACDAIRARRLMEDDNDYGHIIIRSGLNDGKVFIEIEDNGVGMSERILSGPFLDFGTSFWGTALVHKEFPGLETKGYQSIGKFGVGFFSIFMWGEDVTVYTRRYEQGRDSTKVLCFNKNGIERPLLRSATPDEFIKDGGTRVRVYIESITQNDELPGFLSRDRSDSLEDIIKKLCISSDVTIYLENEFDQKERIIKANDWLTLQGDHFLERVLNKGVLKELDNNVLEKLKKLAMNITDIKCNGVTLGRGFLYSDAYRKYTSIAKVRGIVTVGGFRTSTTNDFVGILIGETSRASRDFCLPVINEALFETWLKEQIGKLEPIVDNEEQINISRILRLFGISNNEMKFALSSQGYISLVDFRDILKNNHDEIIILQDAAYSRATYYGKKEVVLNKNVVVADFGIKPIINNPLRSLHVTWPKYYNIKWFNSSTLNGMVIEETLKYWGVSLPDYISYEYNIDEQNSNEERVIGTIDGEDITESVRVLNRKKCLLL